MKLEIVPPTKQPIYIKDLPNNTLVRCGNRRWIVGTCSQGPFGPVKKVLNSIEDYEVSNTDISDDLKCDEVIGRLIVCNGLSVVVANVPNDNPPKYIKDLPYGTVIKVSCISSEPLLVTWGRFASDNYRGLVSLENPAHTWSPVPDEWAKYVQVLGTFKVTN